MREWIASLSSCARRPSPSNGIASLYWYRESQALPLIQFENKLNYGEWIAYTCIALPPMTVVENKQDRIASCVLTSKTIKCLSPESSRMLDRGSLYFVLELVRLP